MHESSENFIACATRAPYANSGATGNVSLPPCKTASAAVLRVMQKGAAKLDVGPGLSICSVQGVPVPVKSPLSGETGVMLFRLETARPREV